MKEYKNILVSNQAGVTTISLNRPSRLNATINPMNEEILSFFEAVTDDRDTGAIILRGEGRAFCSGGDLYEHSEFVDDEFEHEMRIHTKTIFAMLNCAKPIVCALHGAAAGWGATFALFSDIIIADENARISDPHVALGLSTGDGAAIIWPQLMGFPRAKQFLMTGETITGRMAAEFGLVNEALPLDQVQERVEQIAAKLASQPRHAMRMTKASINIPLKNLVQTMMDTCIAFEVATQKGEDHARALQQFTTSRAKQVTARG